MKRAYGEFIFVGMSEVDAFDDVGRETVDTVM